MERFRWTPEISLGNAEMDETHKARLKELAQLAGLPDDRFPAGLRTLVDALGRDFRKEEALMEAIDFPQLPEHREQHALILGGLHQVALRVMQGDIASGREFVSQLPHLYLFHESMMGLALAAAHDLASLPAGQPLLPARAAREGRA